ncbi:MAG: hypothetical protein ACKO8U_10455, partial [Pirellula sp.]
MHHNSIFVPSNFTKAFIQAGCAGQAAAVTKLPLTCALLKVPFDFVWNQRHLAILEIIPADDFT